MPSNPQLNVLEVLVLKSEAPLKGIAKAAIPSWGIEFNNITWGFGRGRLEAKFPVLKRPDKKQPLFLVAFDNKELEKTLKKQLKTQLKIFLREKGFLK